MEIIIDVTYNGKQLVVEKTATDQYQVKVDGEVNHPDLKAEDVMRALGFYMHNCIKPKK